MSRFKLLAFIALITLAFGAAIVGDALAGVPAQEEEAMSDNVAVVRELFAALERGDLPGAMQFVGEEVDWQSPVTRTHPPEIPWSRVRRNKQEVTEFFKELGQKVRPEGFKLLQITAQDDRVVVEGQNRGTVIKTGRTYEHDWVMVFSVGDNKIVRCHHYYDTGDLVGSFRDE